MAEENKEAKDLNTNTDKLDTDSLSINIEKNISEEDTSADYDEMIGKKEEFISSKKKPPLKKVLITLVSFLILLLIVGTVLYFLGFFTPKEEIIQTNVKESIMPVEIKEETYKFDVKDINSKKLNEQLSFLTNKSINQDKKDEVERIENEKRIIEEQKRREKDALDEQEAMILKEKAAIEEKKIQLENEKAQLESLKEEAIILKEELQNYKTKLEITPDAKIQEVTLDKESLANIDEVTNHNKKIDGFLKFINVAKIKGALYKKYLDKIIAVNPNVILCRDDKNIIEIYYGPFENNETRSKLLNKLLNSNFEEAYEVEFTKEEFDKRCNY